MTPDLATTAAAAGSSRRVLAPMERLSEILFGLIMALTFTGSISAAEQGREEIRTLLVGAIGCNLAWGIVDAVMYLLTTISQRARDVAALQRVRTSKDAGAARAAIADALPPLLAPLLRPDDYERLHQELLRKDAPARARLTLDDFRGALGVFLLVFTSTFPMVVPFLIMQEPLRALRTSHAVGIALLFLLGHRLGRYAGLGPWRMGLVMVGVGLFLVGLAIALGG